MKDLLLDFTLISLFLLWVAMGLFDGGLHLYLFLSKLLKRTRR